ncbi:polysaccharide pyruvyl transferase family protein [Curtobacterium poinsettiae]|uniref:polysaccharide pyruvyl transferase family protein n=1 Tax=Curtobacterium poinsettiae TaxID=159612 RepID=UPI00217D36F2|nr:polysaccharide pyruvyl transferase family protein [Curtobacterium flaccumfaciens]MCS6577706.1 polysaccharide pyruvyl transferase family protein [Curtobacterium flaccumfaciens]
MKPPTRRSLVYLGWQGNANFGDDLLYETWRAALDDPLTVQAPLNARDYLRTAPRFGVDRLRTLGTERVVLLGGGTSVGFASWAEHARLAIRNFGADGLIGVGLGAASASDTYSLAQQRQRWEAWRTLQRLHIAGVRGPLTQDEVSAHLMPVDISGDPALLYPLVRHVPRPTRAAPRIGVSLGSDPRSRFDVATVAAAVDEHARDTGATEVVAFALSAADQDAARQLAGRLTTASVVHASTDVAATMAAIGGCDLVVSERLHGAVAAVSLGIATVPLSYASKCDDFWSSVTGRAAPVTVGHSADDLVDAMRAAEQERAGIAERVRELQDRLQRIRGELLAWKSGTCSTSDLLTTSTVSM